MRGPLDRGPRVGEFYGPRTAGARNCWTADRGQVSHVFFGLSKGEFQNHMIMLDFSRARSVVPGLAQAIIGIQCGQARPWVTQVDLVC